MLSSKEEAEWFGAESFEAEKTPFVWCVVRSFDVDDGSGFDDDEMVEMTTVLGVFNYKKDADKAMKSIYNEMKSQGLEEDYSKEGFYTDNGYIKIDKSKLGQLWLPYGAYRFWNAESFEAETTIAKQYGETLDNLDDLQKIVKKTISPKRKPTKFIKDAKSSVVDSWKQMGKDGFRRQMYQPIEFEAEIPKSVKLGFGFGAGLALFQVAVIGSAIGLGMLLNKE